MSDAITFSEFQEAARKTAQYPDVFVGDPADGLQKANYLYPALGLSGEAGEVSEKIKKIVRNNKGKMTPEEATAVAKEIGDVLWYCAELCSQLGMDFGTVAQQNIEKLADRVSRGVIKSEGDNR